MKFSVFLVVLCAVSLKDVLGSCSCNNPPAPTPKCCLEGDACRSYCPKTSPFVNNIFQIVDGLSPEYSLFYLGGKIYFLFRAALDVSAPGEPQSAQLTLFDLVVFLFELRGKIYYMSTVGFGNPYGGCARVAEVRNTTKSEIPSLVYPNDLLLEMIRQFNKPFERQCTVLPKSIAPVSPGAERAQYIFALNNLYSALVCQPSDQNNASFSAFKDATTKNGEDEFVRISPGFVEGRSYCEYGSNIDTECGVPPYCPMLNSLDNFEDVIRRGKCDPNCINTVNKNAVSVASRCYAAGSTLSTQPPPTTTSFKATLFGPLSNAKIFFFLFAGYLYSAAFNDFIVKFFLLS